MSTNSRFPLSIQIMNISSNLTRLSEWVSGDYEIKMGLIKKFTDQTDEYINELSNQTIPIDLRATLDRLRIQFNVLKEESISEQNKLKWAERALTWANILQHRSKLA